MKEFIKQNWFKLGIFLLLILVIGGGFYWFQIRPMAVRQYCWAKAYRETISARGDRTDANYYYERCFREMGLKDSY